jgi:hypothetical protein
VPKAYENIYENVLDETRRIYLGMVSLLDEAVGNLTRTLSRLNLLDDTIIFFTSDVAYFYSLRIRLNRFVLVNIIGLLIEEWRCTI